MYVLLTDVHVDSVFDRWSFTDKVVLFEHCVLRCRLVDSSAVRIEITLKPQVTGYIVESDVILILQLKLV